MRTYSWSEVLEAAEEELREQANSAVEHTRWLNLSDGRDAAWYRRRELARREELLQALELSQLVQ